MSWFRNCGDPGLIEGRAEQILNQVVTEGGGSSFEVLAAEKVIVIVRKVSRRRKKQGGALGGSDRRSLEQRRTSLSWRTKCASSGTDVSHKEALR